tara:strand:- start:79 stop:330 length:252 start_codon:yes stop_codon:yes gene_type:complete
MINLQSFLALFYIQKSFFHIMRRRHMLGTHDKTLCGWSVTTGELTQLKKMDSKYVNCKRCLEKLDAANQPSSNLKNKRAIPHA